MKKRGLISAAVSQKTAGRKAVKQKVMRVFLAVVLALGLMPATALANTLAAEPTEAPASMAASVEAPANALAPTEAPANATTSVEVVAPANEETLPATTAFASTQAFANLQAAVDIPGDNLADPFLEEPVLTPGWMQSGTCEWMIDSDGLLTVRPLGNSESGTLANWSSFNGTPWYSQGDKIKRAVITPGVIAKTGVGLFCGCKNLESVDLSGLDTSQVTSLSCMFYNCTNLTSVDFSMFDLSSLDASAAKRNTSDMLCRCFSLTELKLPAGMMIADASGHDIAWKDSAGAIYETSSAMFAANAARESGAMTYSSLASEGWLPTGTCEWSVDESGLLVVRPLPDREQGNLETVRTNPWDFVRGSVKSVRINAGVNAKTCTGMFYGCTQLESVNLSGLNTSSAQSTNSMFYDCRSLTSLDLSGFDTSQVTDMGNMFTNCVKLASLNLLELDTANVTDMRSMFFACSALTSLDLSALNTANVTNMTSMFYKCSALVRIYVSKDFTAERVTSSNNMFYGCTALAGGRGTAYDSSAVDAARACVDGGTAAPGYLTGKHDKLDGDVNNNGVLNIVDAQVAYEIATKDSYESRPDYANMRVRADVNWDDEVDAADAFAIQYAVHYGW